MCCSAVGRVGPVGVLDGHQPSLTKGGFLVPHLATLTLAATWNWPPEGRHPKVPVRQWVPSLPIPLCVLLATQPELVTPALQVVQRVVARYLLEAAGLKADECNGGAVALTQLRLGC
jgi:hypothetical protein